jgi:VWFA-related protein
VTTVRIAFAIALAVIASAAAQQPEQPVFRAGVDVFAVEVSALDRDGKPITDLTAQDFVVTVDGKPRRVRAVRFHGADSEDAMTGGTPMVPGPVVNSRDDGRIVVFVVDRESIAPGGERAIVESAATILDGLGPSSAAGVLELPGSATDLTRDHARVRAALMRVTGSRPTAVNQFAYNLSWDEALAFERNDRMTTARAVDRECLGINRPPGRYNRCPDDLRLLATEMRLTGRVRTQGVLDSLSSLAKQLAPMRGAKQVVLLTGGFPFGQDLLPFYNQFAKVAAEAQIVFYAVHLDQPGTDVTARKSTTSPFGGAEFASGVGNVATMTGGAFYMASGNGAEIFERVRSEIHNFYELAVEMEAVDLKAEELDVDVQVTRPGAVVRNRRRVLSPGRPALPTADRLGELLRQPIDLGETSLSLSAYTMRGDEPSMLRTIVGIEAGSSMNNGPAEWAFAVYNEGNVVATGRQRLDGAAGPWSAALSAKLLPGRYRLRAAMLDGAGRAGVLERPLEVGLRGDARIQFSDLIVGVADANGRLQPASRVQQGVSMSALVEVISADPAALEQVRTVFEIVPGGSATPVKRFVMGARNGNVAAILTNQAEIATADLAPGRYTASATPMRGEQPLGRVSRVFEIVAK